MNALQLKFIFVKFVKLIKLVDHRFRIPGNVEDFLGDCGGKVEDEDG